MAAPSSSAARLTAMSFFRVCPLACVRIVRLNTSQLNNRRYLCTRASIGVDIGLSKPRESRRTEFQQRQAYLKQNRNDVKLEQAARHRKLKISLDEMKKDWETTAGPYHILDVAHHYNIFQDLFDGAHFLPQIIMHVNYEQSQDFSVPVYRGNVVSPAEATNAPSVFYESSADDLWTLLFTNPDGHLLDNEAEYLHWMIGNIPGNDLHKGDVLCDYLKPFPASGTGYHRLVFVLFKQSQRIDFTSEQRQAPCYSLRERTFKTLDFYKKFEDLITPAGLSFFQCRWDKSVTDVFRQTLDMREPYFEYDHPPLYIAPQKKWPRRRRIQYLNKYIPPE
ncbi:large ribosomal subunit protein mL38-like [Ptychodera flava]|uniref:large ribosomal subunit protein mL38-like n=1 Tax=Ptychodera flava TaxID=63121 RepID=UPI00396A3BD5